MGARVEIVLTAATVFLTVVAMGPPALAQSVDVFVTVPGAAEPGPPDPDPTTPPPDDGAPPSTPVPAPDPAPGAAPPSPRDPLPRTGNDAGDLLTWAGVLLALGSVLLIGTRHVRSPKGARHA